MDPWDATQVSRLGDTCLYPPRHFESLDEHKTEDTSSGKKVFLEHWDKPRAKRSPWAYIPSLVYMVRNNFHEVLKATTPI